MGNFLERVFHLQQKGTNVKTEVIAGITTFATMAYILAVNVNILSDAGLDEGAVFVATALSSIIGTVCMGLLANLPLAIAPGMGLNAFFAYTVVIGMGFSPQLALAAVLTEGVIFVILSKTGIRTKLFNSIPLSIKYAVGGGIGFFILFIGAQNAGIIAGSPATLVALGDLGDPAVALAIAGSLLTIVLLAAKVKGALLIGIMATWMLGIIAQLIGWYEGAYSLIPGGVVDLPPSLAPTFGLAFRGFAEAFTDGSTILSFLLVTFSFLFVDIFDTIGTLAGVASKANMLDSEGRLEKADEALFSDAVSTTTGAILGTSTTTTYIESAAGVMEGGRSGLTAMVVSAGFALSLLLWPIFQAIPGFATATALIAVGIMMMEPLKHIKFDEFDELAPVAITLIAMPLLYSISDGLFFGIVTFIVAKAAAKKFKEISPMMWGLGAIYIIKITTDIIF
jgi:AGZA family xanthine/uracil permease-like MFS transporter